MPHKPFRDRVDAGRQLARRLRPYRDLSPVVLGLPRGGVPVAYEIAQALGAPLDVCVVRKVAAPLQPEIGIGAVSEDRAVHVDRNIARLLGVSNEELASIIEEKRAEVEERVVTFRRGEPPENVRGRTVIVVDDGIATGGTARAAVVTLRRRGAAYVILAVPVAPSSTVDDLTTVADKFICLYSEESFDAVSLYYDDFIATTDDEVILLLDRARRNREGKYGSAGFGTRPSTR